MERRVAANLKATPTGLFGTISKFCPFLLFRQSLISEIYVVNRTVRAR